MVNSKNLVLNPILCYISTAYVSKSPECIIDCCTPFFDFSKIKEARELLSSYVEVYDKQEPGRRGPKSAKNMIIEILETIQKCKADNIELPMFVANAYNSMPPISGYDVVGGTLSVLIDELFLLKDDIREIKQLSRVPSKDIKLLNDEVSSLRNESREINNHFNSIRASCLDDMLNTTSLDIRNEISEIKNRLDLLTGGKN